MNCTKCGAEMAPESKFCVVCGTPVGEAPVTAPVETTAPVEQAAPVATAAPEEKEGFKIDVNAVKDQLAETLAPVWTKVKPIVSKKSFKIGIAAALVLVIVIGILSAALSSGNGYIQLKQYTVPTSIDGEINIIVNKKVLSDTIESDGVSDYATSLDGTVTVITTAEDELYVVNGKKVKKVAEDVYDFELSVSGKGIAYVTEDEGAMSLSLYTVSNGKSSTITDELSSLNYVIAPDGKSVAFYEENDDGEDVLYYSKGSDAVKITSNECELYGMSNGGKYIYVSCETEVGEDSDAEIETNLYSYDTKGERTKLGNIGSSSIRFNDDHTQVMFYNEGKTYIANKGKEAEKASSNRLSMVIAPNASYFSDSTSTTYPVSSLYDHVYSASDDDSTSIWMIKKNSDKSVKLVSKVTSYRLDESAEYLYYIYDSEELRVIKISDGEKATERYTKLAEDVSTFRVTSDRDLVYYVSDGTLYSVNGKKGGRSTTVCNDEIDGLVLNGKDVCYYFLDGDLYATTNGKKGSKVMSDISDGFNTPNGLVYVSNDDTVYVTDGSKKPSKLIDLG